MSLQDLRLHVLSIDVVVGLGNVTLRHANYCKQCVYTMRSNVMLTSIINYVDLKLLFTGIIDSEDSIYKIKIMLFKFTLWYI